MSDLFVSIVSGGEQIQSLPPLTMIVAHPDDETAGAGAVLPWLTRSSFLYVTDGAPHDIQEALAAGFQTREQYATARRIERRAVFSLAGIDEDHVQDLEIAGRDASFHLAALARQIAEFLDEKGHSFVITHPYEGGHPDHDATAFAVHAACRLLNQWGAAVPVIVEMTSYHSRDGRLAISEFLPGESCPTAIFELNETQRLRKQQLLDCYATQRPKLERLLTERECFRLAPEYNFTEPPHEGPLYYEQFSWGMTGEQFRRLAAEALEQLGLDP